MALGWLVWRVSRDIWRRGQTKQIFLQRPEQDDMLAFMIQHLAKPQAAHDQGRNEAAEAPQP